MPSTMRREHGRAEGYLRVALSLLATAVLLAPQPAEAYIGPGAGFALLSSVLVTLATTFIAFLSLLLWPIRALRRWVKRRKLAAALVKRVIIVGFDGQDPKITRRLLIEGKLPHLKRLAEMGGFEELRTTFPSISPVAWSSFSTGTNPGRHNIFDFIDRDPRTYLPRLSSTYVASPKRFLKLGRWRIPLEKADIRLLRKSKPFWSILGEYSVWSSIVRVPITFPPDRFYGAELSAMSVPDLLGTQGTFLLYTTRPGGGGFKAGGLRIALEPDGDRFESSIKGPENHFIDGEPPLEIPLSIDLDRQRGRARILIDGKAVELEPRRLSSWVTLNFRAAPGVRVAGLCRLMVIEMEEHFSLYVSPISIDPEKPAMPISHPPYYATYLAKRIGPFCTLGLAEDTSALNEGVTDDTTFLQQAYDIDHERREMFFAAWDRLRRGVLVCVFDATDRIQHMFWRHLDDGHPAARGREDSRQGNAIEDIYEHNDELVGRILERLEQGDLLFVISDHGFGSFRRGVNLNCWFRAQGLLTLKEGSDGKAEWLRGVDWSRTRAYSLGLSGVYLNRAGRESEGLVSEAEAELLKSEIIEKLRGIVDPLTGQVAIKEVFDTAQVYSGPYLENAPDLIVGYNDGYRISWDGATGVVDGPVFEDNVKPWSGDHCIDPRLVPGILFCTRKIDAPDPALIDIAPTVLSLFGVPPPGYMEGKPLFNLDAWNDE